MLETFEDDMMGKVVISDYLLNACHCWFGSVDSKFSQITGLTCNQIVSTFPFDGDGLASKLR